jgi:hypothetical protein
MRVVWGYETAGGLQTCAGYSCASGREPAVLAAELCRAEPSPQSSDIRNRREGLKRVSPS